VSVYLSNDELAARLQAHLVKTIPGVTVGAGDGELVVYLPQRAKVGTTLIPRMLAGVPVRRVRVAAVRPA